MKGQTVDSFLSHLIQSVHFTSEMLVIMDRTQTLSHKELSLCPISVIS